MDLVGRMVMNDWLVVSNMFYFCPYLGKIPILINIFQLGWNHQLEMNDVFFRWLEVYTNLLKYWIAYADIDGFRVYLSSRFAEQMPSWSCNVIFKVPCGQNVSPALYCKVECVFKLLSTYTAKRNVSPYVFFAETSWSLQEPSKEIEIFWTSSTDEFRVADVSSQLSHEKNLGWLGYIGDYTTQVYGDYNEPL